MKIRSQLGVLMLLIATGVLAEPQPQDPPTPFKAEYVGTYKGLPIKAKGIRELIRLPSGEYQFTSSAKALLVNVSEVSRFSVVNGQVVPASYEYRRGGLGRNKQESVTFDWANMQVDSTGGGAPLEAGVLDKLSYQVQLRLSVAAARAGHQSGEDIPLVIADEEKRKEYVFRIAGEETLTTPTGDLATVRLERVHDRSARKTILWLAVDHEFLLVRLAQEDEDSGFELNLERFDWH